MQVFKRIGNISVAEKNKFKYLKEQEIHILQSIKTQFEWRM